jgi:ABC-type branched-subunit amino acid transport system ATPase component
MRNKREDGREIRGTHLSLGYRQELGIVRALLNSANLLNVNNESLL